MESLQELLSPILSRSPAFFPEYTDHGILHINNVLDFAANLIQGKTISKNAMNARDVACLIAAILIHDLGMFLTSSGVTMLMGPEWDSNRYNRFTLRYDAAEDAASVWMQDRVLKTTNTVSKLNWARLNTDVPDGICTTVVRNHQFEMPLRRKDFPIGTFPAVIHVRPRDESFLRLKMNDLANSLFVQTLKETLVPSEGYDPDDHWIPFDRTERKRKFRKAFEELAPYMDHIRTERVRGNPWI